MRKLGILAALGAVAMLGLAPPPVLAQIDGTLEVAGPGVAPDAFSVIAVPVGYDKLTVTWNLTAGTAPTLQTVDGDTELGFRIYYVDHMGMNGGTPSPAQLAAAQRALNTEEDYVAAMGKVDVGKPSRRSVVTDGGDGGNDSGVQFVHTISGLKQDRLYAVAVVAYDDPLKADLVPDAQVARDRMNAAAATGKAPVPTDVRSIEVMPDDKKLMVSWERPTNTGSTSLTIAGYEVRWRTSQTASEPAGTDIMTYPPAAGMMLTSTMYEIPNLINGITYDVQVRAVNSAGAAKAWDDSDWDEDQGTPSADAMTPKPKPTPALPTAALFLLGGLAVAGGRRQLRAARERKRLTR